MRNRLNSILDIFRIRFEFPKIFVKWKFRQSRFHENSQKCWQMKPLSKMLTSEAPPACDVYDVVANWFSSFALISCFGDCFQNSNRRKISVLKSDNLWAVNWVKLFWNQCESWNNHLKFILRGTLILDHRLTRIWHYGLALKNLGKFKMYSKNI